MCSRVTRSKKVKNLYSNRIMNFSKETRSTISQTGNIMLTHFTTEFIGTLSSKPEKVWYNYIKYPIVKGGEK